MPRGSFLCGCPIGPRKGYSPRYVGRTEMELNGKTIVTNPGVEVCPEHGAMPYGYVHSKGDPGGETLTGRMGSGIEDKRDLQDPQRLGELLIEEAREWKWDRETTLSGLHDELRLYGVKAPRYDG